MRVLLLLQPDFKFAIGVPHVHVDSVGRADLVPQHDHAAISYNGCGWLLWYRVSSHTHF